MRGKLPAPSAVKVAEPRGAGAPPPKTFADGRGGDRTEPQISKIIALTEDVLEAEIAACLPGTSPEVPLRGGGERGRVGPRRARPSTPGARLDVSRAAGRAARRSNAGAGSANGTAPGRRGSGGTARVAPAGLAPLHADAFGGCASAARATSRARLRLASIRVSRPHWSRFRAIVALGWGRLGKGQTSS